ncbi:MAG: ribbon-helix-helix domain-containing protein [Candidatus Thermoplasmatota archaeon]
MPAETERVTLRLPVNLLSDLDRFVESGQYMNRSDAIRAAISDFVRSRAKEVEESVAARASLMESVDKSRRLRELSEMVAEKVRAEIEEQMRNLK